MKVRNSSSTMASAHKTATAFVARRKLAREYCDSQSTSRVLGNIDFDSTFRLATAVFPS